MIIDIRELRQRGEPLLVKARFSDEQLRVQNQISILDSPVAAQMELSVSGERVRIAGGLSARLQITCSRCLQIFSSPLEKQFELEYWPDPEGISEGEEVALAYSDLAIGFYRNEEIDLRVVVSEQIVLEIPMKPVCGENCKGLCDQCGADLNEGECGCRRRSVDPRLAALIDLKKKFSH